MLRRYPEDPASLDDLIRLTRTAQEEYPDEAEVSYTQDDRIMADGGLQVPLPFFKAMVILSLVLALIVYYMPS